MPGDLQPSQCYAVMLRYTDDPELWFAFLGHDLPELAGTEAGQTIAAELHRAFLNVRQKDDEMGAVEGATVRALHKVSPQLWRAAVQRGCGKTIEQLRYEHFLVHGQARTALENAVAAVERFSNKRLSAAARKKAGREAIQEIASAGLLIFVQVDVVTATVLRPMFRPIGTPRDGGGPRAA